MPSSTTARFINCRWSGARIAACSFLGCTFDRCAWSDVVFSFCQMSDAWLLHCAFRSIAWGGLQGRSALVQPFGRAEQCEFRYNEFSGMALKQFDFSKCTFGDCVFDDCKLAGADFRGAALGSTAFSRCDLQKADFREASGYRIDPGRQPDERCAVQLPGCDRTAERVWAGHRITYLFL